MGLRQGDLKDMIYDIFEIDSFASKMGADKDIVTLSFSVKERQSADDLMRFFENGYNFVLDADATKGEQSDGTYKVFVELAREKGVTDYILELLEGLKSLSAVDDFRFRYYKNFRSRTADKENIEEAVPVDPENYGISVNESNLDNYKNFFNKSFLDSIDMLDDTLIIKKAFADPIAFEFIDYGDRETVLESIDEPMNILESYPEIMFLTKYLGDYNICKYGKKLVLENQSKALVLKKI